MVSAQPSRFALLNIDDDSDIDNDKPSESDNKAAQANRKKNKRKKKVSQQKEIQELRNSAFLRPTKAGGKKPGGAAQAEARGSESPGGGGPARGQHGAQDQDWEKWQKRDEEFTADHYQKDLQQALMMSKLDFEEQKQTTPGDKEGSKGPSQKSKKKKQDKPMPMSLGDFLGDKPQENGSGDIPRDSSAQKSPPVKEEDPKFFKNIDTDVHRILNSERQKEDFKRNYVDESLRTKKQQEDIESRDAKIEELTAANTKLTAELKEVKQRNQTLCNMLAHGEMKDKTSVLLELDQLKQVRDELTTEVGQLTGDLERERSKVHALEGEKKHGGKHGSKHGK